MACSDRYSVGKRVGTAVGRSIRCVTRSRLRASVEFAANARYALFDCCDHVTTLQLRRDVVVDDALRFVVGECGMKAATDLDPKMMIGIGNDDDDSIVRRLASDTPRIREAERVLFDGLRAGCRDDRHRDLIASASLVVVEVAVDALFIGVGDNLGCVHEWCGESWIDLGGAVCRPFGSDGGCGGCDNRSGGKGRSAEEMNSSPADSGNTSHDWVSILHCVPRFRWLD